MRFTRETIRSIPFGPERGKWYTESGRGAITGLLIVAYPASRVYHVRFRTKTGARKVVRIGDAAIVTPEAARAKAREILAKASLGGDPALERDRARKTPTFAAFVKDFLEEVDLRKKSPREDHRFLGRAVKLWGTVPVNEITRDDMVRAHVALGKEHPTAANRFLASVRAAFSEAARRGLIQANPARGIKHHAENPPRARVLTDPEMRAVLAALAAEEDVYARAALEVLVQTGARLSEVIRAKWEDVDEAAGTWRIPSPKSGKPQVVPLSRSTLALLRRVPRVKDCPYIFPGRFTDRPRADLRDAWDRAKTVAAKAAPSIRDVRIHDLRRTFGLAVARTAGLHVASKLLRHSDIRVTEAVYAPLGVEDLRAALERRTLPFPDRKAGGR